MHERRVVVSGMGAVTPLGCSVSGFWDGLISSRSGVRTIQHFDCSRFDVHFGGVCADFEPSSAIDPRRIKRMDRFAQMALIAARQAFAESGLQGQFDPRRVGVVLGTGIGGLGEIEDQHLRLLQKGPSKVSAFTIPKLMANAGSATVSIEFGFQAVNATVSTACASAGNAMADAWRSLQRGDADIIFTGGTEATVTPLGIAAFAAMKALSTRNESPQHASRPFDKDRDGFVLSEGAGILVFEDYEHALKRGAPIYCEVIGVGTTADAGDIVQPDPEGRGGARAMAEALASARINPEDVDYINAHGTSTVLGDVAETKAIKAIFGAQAYKVPVSSTKSAVGHLLGASGGVEAIASIMALRSNTLPPTINLEHPDPECDLDYVPNTARDARTRTVMSNSFGFGGHNACIIFRKM
jgi:3-oxoacyl-[acyl-carrier-protein] synthase II